MPLSTESESKSDDVCPWSKLSNEPLHDASAKLSDEEQGDKMDISDQPATLLQPPKCGLTTKAFRQKPAWIIRETHVFNLLETEL